MSGNDQPAEVTDEQVYEDLKAYQRVGMLEYVLPSEPLGEQWIIGWDGQILKFFTKEGIVGFLTGIGVCASFAAMGGPKVHAGYREEPGIPRFGADPSEEG